MAKTPTKDNDAGGRGSGARKARDRARVEREAAAAAARRRRTLTTVVVGIVVLAIVGGIAGLVAWQNSKTDTGARAPKGVVPPYTATASPTASGSPSPGTSTGSNQSSVDPNAKRQSTSTAAGMGWGVGVGNAAAPVTLELFEDFSCPHCNDLEATLGAQVKQSVDGGRLRVIYYPMTLPGFGTPTETAANGFACASDEGKAEQFHDALYANFDRAQQQWSNSLLESVGKAVGLASGTFNRCLSNNTFREWVRSIDDTADARGVTGTPTAFVNGVRVPPQETTADAIMARVSAADAATSK